MEWSTYAVGSVTNAMRGKAVLESHGYAVQVHRSTDASREGCGYELRVRGGGFRASELLRGAGIRPSASGGNKR